MREASHVPELQDDLAALGVHGVGDEAPAGDLCVVVDARRPGVAFAHGGDLRRFGDDQAGGGALRVVDRIELMRHVGAARCAVARERRHDDAVLEVDAAEDVRGEEARSIA